MDEKRLKEIEERAAKATPGPWTTAGIDRRPYISNTLRVQDTNFWNLANFINAEDASFIAASRQDITDLLAEVKRLRGLLFRVLEEGHIAFDLRLEIEAARK